MRNRKRVAWLGAIVVALGAGIAGVAFAGGGNHKTGGGAIPNGTYTNATVNYDSNAGAYHITGDGFDFWLDELDSSLSEKEKKALDMAGNQGDANNTVTMAANNCNGASTS